MYVCIYVYIYMEGGRHSVYLHGHIEHICFIIYTEVVFQYECIYMEGGRHSVYLHGHIEHICFIIYIEVVLQYECQR